MNCFHTTFALDVAIFCALTANVPLLVASGRQRRQPARPMAGIGYISLRRLIRNFHYSLVSPPEKLVDFMLRSDSLA